MFLIYRYTIENRCITYMIDVSGCCNSAETVDSRNMGRIPPC